MLRSAGQGEQCTSMVVVVVVVVVMMMVMEGTQFTPCTSVVVMVVVMMMMMMMEGTREHSGVTQVHTLVYPNFTIHSGLALPAVWSVVVHMQPNWPYA